MNWGYIAKIDYLCLAKSFVRAIGELLGGIFVSLQKVDSDFLRNLNVIGHSLGGHIAGFAAQRVQRDLPGGPLINNLIGKTKESLVCLCEENRVCFDIK